MSAGSGELLEIGGWAVALAIAIGGWISSSRQHSDQLKHEAELQRALLRKQTALQLLNDNRFEPAWVDALRAVSKAVHANGAERRLTEIAERFCCDKETDEERDLCNHIRIVLNFFEFISIAILNCAADEKVLRWSYGYYFEKLHTVLGGFIATIRRGRHDEALFINFTTLAVKWKREPDTAKPTD